MRAYVLVVSMGVVFLLLSSSSYGAEVAKTVYSNRCQSCHGENGKGNQTMAKAMQTTIPDLTSNAIAKKSDAELLEALSKGKGKMPAQTGLSNKELKEVLVTCEVSQRKKLLRRLQRKSQLKNMRCSTSTPHQRMS